MKSKGGISLKIKIPVVLWLGMSAMIILVGASIYISSQKNEIKVEEHILLGSKETVEELSDQLKVEIRYVDGSSFYNDVVYELGDEVKASSRFYPNYYDSVKFYDVNFIRIGLSSFDFTSVLNEMSSKIEQERTIRVADYYKYVPAYVGLNFSGVGSRYLQDGGELVQIKVPEELQQTLEEGMTYAQMSGLLSFAEFDTPYVKVGDSFYFTITNTNQDEMELRMKRAVEEMNQLQEINYENDLGLSKDEAQKTDIDTAETDTAETDTTETNIIETDTAELDKTKVNAAKIDAAEIDSREIQHGEEREEDISLYEYNFKSGIYKVNRNSQIKKVEDIERIYPVELSDKKDVYIVALDYVEEVDQLVLFTVEKGNIYATFIDRRSDSLMGKYEIGRYDKEDNLFDYKFIVKENQIILLYIPRYGAEDDQNRPLKNKIFIYDLSYDPLGDDMANTSPVKEVFEREWLALPTENTIARIYDAYLEEGVLYLLTYNDVAGGYPNGAKIIAMDGMGIRYIRVITDHMQEDQNNRIIMGDTQYATGSMRHINDMKFVH